VGSLPSTLLRYFKFALVSVDPPSLTLSEIIHFGKFAVNLFRFVEGVVMETLSLKGNLSARLGFCNSQVRQSTSITVHLKLVTNNLFFPSMRSLAWIKHISVVFK